MDKRDYQILDLLGQNARLPNSAIAEALHISKDTVIHRIQQLEKNQSILQYMTFVDARVLGFTRYHVLIRLDAGILDKAALYNKVGKHPSVMWLNTFIGCYDIQIIVDAKDGFALNAIREELFVACEHKVKEYIILTHLSDFAFTNLNPIVDLGTTCVTKNDFSFSDKLMKKQFAVSPAFERYHARPIEADLLQVLADNPRASLLELSAKLKINRQTVKKHILQLIDKKVIINFGAIPNYSQLGFVVYYLLVRIAQGTPHSALIKPFHHLNNIFYAGHMIGNYDLILYLNARNPEELNSSIEEFKKHTAQYILHYDLLVQDKVHHWRQFTPGIYASLKS